jgi:hypothetical protein
LFYIDLIFWVHKVVYEKQENDISAFVNEDWGIVTDVPEGGREGPGAISDSVI